MFGLSHIWTWVTETLKSWNLYGKTARILFLGLDNAGKTTLLHMLTKNKLVQHTPTRNPTSEEMVMGGVTFRAIDLGGHKAARKIWKDYFTAIDGIVFLVDASDSSRFEESKAELDALLLDDDLGGVPILVLGNKIDADTAVSEGLLRTLFGLVDTGASQRPIEVFMCSVVLRQGFGDGLRWLAKFLP
jgi:GTP-binding protein SAR1